MKLNYPQIEGAEDIVGWEGVPSYRINLKVGKTTEELPDHVGYEFKKTYPFLKVEAKAIPKKENEVSIEKEDSAPTKETSGGLLSFKWQDLLKLAKEKGVYKRGASKEDLIKILESNK